jgi:hypothetical protein
MASSYDGTLAAAESARNKRKNGRDLSRKRERESGEVMDDESKAFS